MLSYQHAHTLHTNLTPPPPHQYIHTNLHTTTTTTPIHSHNLHTTTTTPIHSHHHAKTPSHKYDTCKLTLSHQLKHAIIPKQSHQHTCTIITFIQSYKYKHTCHHTHTPSHTTMLHCSGTHCQSSGQCPSHSVQLSISLLLIREGERGREERWGKKRR